MKKLLSLFMLVAFLFAEAPSTHKLIVNSLGNLQLVEVSKMPAAVDIAVTPSVVVIEENCNGPPANS